MRVFPGAAVSTGLQTTDPVPWGLQRTWVSVVTGAKNTPSASGLFSYVPSLSFHGIRESSRPRTLSAHSTRPKCHLGASLPCSPPESAALAAGRLPRGVRVEPVLCLHSDAEEEKRGTSLPA